MLNACNMELISEQSSGCPGSQPGMNGQVKPPRGEPRGILKRMAELAIAK
jgi:hypothetical protein